MAESILSLAGLRTGLVGTIMYRLGARNYPALHTTPMADDLQRMLADMLARGARAVVMEVSSHSLAQGRVTGTSFRAGVFTNLTRDHMDFHRTMARYFGAKAMLFGALPGSEVGGTAVLNWDNAAGRSLARMTTARILPFSSAEGGRLNAVRGGLWASRVRATAAGTAFTLNESGGRTVPVRLRMVGAHNVSNALAAAGAARVLGAGMVEVKRGLEALAHVPGRMERVPLRAPFSVVVDYAHTPDALERVLAAVRPLARRRVIAVFGCGGNRDRTKRPIMGRIATERADIAWVTSDNPRDEDPLSIIEEIRAGVRRRDRLEWEPDRRTAIRKALAAARGGDVVVVAGKGHEREQVVGNRRFPFHDPAVVRAEWKRLGARA
jgi:UDP-N-acetylmuramoyl-L-alanyl-D-glutamate--2,6-diaminopimelate ligase